MQNAGSGVKLSRTAVNMMNETAIIKNHAYGGHERRIMDLYIPSAPLSRSGIVLFIHGGGWTQGDKSDHSADARYLSGLGYLCASMNYRFISDTVSVSDELDDIDRALAEAERVCVSRGFNPDKSFLSGSSAGAHLALLYALTRRDSSPLPPAGVFAYCPPTDLTAPDFLAGLADEFEEWKNTLLSHCCGVEITQQNRRSEPVLRALAEISPLTYAGNASFPIGICHGRHDDLVPYESSLTFLRKLDGMNVPHCLITYENSGHALDKDPGAAEKASEMMKQYLETAFAAG